MNLQFYFCRPIQKILKYQFTLSNYALNSTDLKKGIHVVKKPSYSCKELVSQVVISIYSCTKSRFNSPLLQYRLY